MFYIKDEPEAARTARQDILNAFADLEFYEEGHRYVLNGKEITQSVSGIGHRFIRFPFDEIAQSERYAQRNGMTPEYWRLKWHRNSFRATTLGTKTHEYGESLGYLRAGLPELILPSMRVQYSKEYNYLAPIHPKEEAVLKFMRELPSSMHLVLNETKVYSGKNPDPSRNLKELICGTFDMLYWYDGDGDASKAGYIILDYKTNNNLYSTYNQEHHRTLLPPFDDFIEQDVSLYTIQLSLYAIMLEDIGYKVIDRRLVWLTNEGEYQIVPVPDVTERLRNCI